MKVKILLLGGLLGFSLVAQTSEKPSPVKQAEKKSASKVQQVMTGCLDEQDGTYVLLEERNMTKIISLQAVNAGNEAVFAKHMGEKVRVKGVKSPDQNGTLNVTSIEKIAASCVPDTAPK